MKRYNIIYSDPAWSFKTYSEKGKEKKSAENHYPCMTLEDIFNLPVKQIAADDCVLFLWVTNPMLREGLETIARWGFEYKTVGFSWFKRNKKADSWFWGLGYWTRQNTEHCLLATRGKPQRVSKGILQVVDSDDPFASDPFAHYDTEQINDRIMRHSQKPATVRHRIVELMGDIPRIEMFAREGEDGWDTWGYDAPMGAWDLAKGR